MSFRKRNIVLASPGQGSKESAPRPAETNVPGVRPSPLDGRFVTSTGTRSLDLLLAGHTGLALGSSLLIEESGSTDFGGSLLRYYTAEGVVQGHHVHVLGMNESWSRELPGILAGGEAQSTNTLQSANEEKMKIAWRYERLGQFKAEERGAAPSQVSPKASVFCHDFDLSKRLVLPSNSLIRSVPFGRQISTASASPFQDFIDYLFREISISPPDSIHRVVVPGILSPTVYPFASSAPKFLLQFLHSLRALLRNYPTQVTAMVTLPLSLYPRSTGITRWAEILSDGVLELAPFLSSSASVIATGTGASNGQEELPQGMLKVHRLPIFHEKGGGGGESSGVGDDMAFNMSRRKGLVIKPYSLPPMEGDTDTQEKGLVTDQGGKAAKIDVEF